MEMSSEAMERVLLFLVLLEKRRIEFTFLFHTPHPDRQPLSSPEDSIARHTIQEPDSALFSSKVDWRR